MYHNAIRKDERDSKEVSIDVSRRDGLKNTDIGKSAAKLDRCDTDLCLCK